MTTHILGISAFYHDSAACLVRDGEIVAAAQEERFTRKKHDHRFPHKAIAYCLGEGGLRPGDLDAVSLEQRGIEHDLQGEQIDKALEPVGPIAKGIAAGMEAANAKVAYMLKFMIPQWYDTKRIIEYIGPDNITQDVLDYDPSSLVPSHMPDEYVNGELPMVGEGPSIRPKTSEYDQVSRARWFAKNLRLISVPNTLLKITAQAEQLKWLTLKRQQAPISWATVMKKLGIENYGDVKGNTEREKYINESIEDLKLKAMAAQMMQALGLGEPAGPGQGKGGGRPPSGKKPAKVAQKGGAGGDARTVVKES